MKTEHVNQTATMIVGAAVKTVADRINTPTPTMPDSPATLQRGDVLYRETVDMGLGYSADIVATYNGAAEQAPSGGSTWPDEHDHPEVEMSITMVRGDAILGGTVLDETTGPRWGQPMPNNRGQKCKRFTRPLLSAALDAALQCAAKDLGAVKIVLAKRAARLERRAKTTQSGIDISAI